jgi:hypothetical protein
VLASSSGRTVVTNICQGVIYSNAVLRESCIDSILNERTLSEEQAHRCMRKAACSGLYHPMFCGYQLKVIHKESTL